MEGILTLRFDWLCTIFYCLIEKYGRITEENTVGSSTKISMLYSTKYIKFLALLVNLFK